MRLEGKVALISGGARGQGAAEAKLFAGEGAKVVFGDILDDLGKQVEAEIHEVGGEALYIHLDVTNAADWASAVEAAVSRYGRLDVLVNNGLDAQGKDLTEVSFEEFAQHQANNAGYFELARLLHDHAVQRGAPASVINLGSMYGQVGSYPDAYEGICSASSVAYHSLKGGTIQMTRHLAVYWARDKVRVNCLSPGAFPNMSEVPAAMVKRLEGKCPMGRMGEPTELKGAIVFLASGASSYMTGQNLTIDGGWTAW